MQKIIGGFVSKQLDKLGSGWKSALGIGVFLVVAVLKAGAWFPGAVDFIEQYQVETWAMALTGVGLWHKNAKVA